MKIMEPYDYTDLVEEWETKNKKSTEMLADFGQFAIEFECVCQTITNICFDILLKHGLNNEALCQYLLCSSTAGKKLEQLRGFYKCVANSEDFKFIKKTLFKELDELIKRRNSLIHQPWQTAHLSEDGASLVAFNNAVTSENGDKQPYNLIHSSEVIDLLDECRLMSVKLMVFKQHMFSDVSAKDFYGEINSFVIVKN